MLKVLFVRPWMNLIPLPAIRVASLSTPPPSDTQLSFWYRCGPKGWNRGACDRTTAKFGTQVNWISQQNVNWTLAQVETLELNSANFKALELKIYRNLWFWVKVESWELKYAEMRFLQMANRAWNMVFRAAHTPNPSVNSYPIPVMLHHICHNQ